MLRRQTTAERVRVRGSAFGAALALCALVAAGPAQAARPPKVGEAAPDFQATLFDGRKVSLADYRGQVLILNFWATWCGPCKRELPLINGYYKIMQPHGMAVIAVTTQDSVSDYDLKPLAKMLAFPLAHGIRGPYRDLNAIPTNYIIDRAGVVRYAKAAGLTLDDLNTILIPLLEAPAPDAAPPVTTASLPLATAAGGR